MSINSVKEDLTRKLEMFTNVPPHNEKDIKSRLDAMEEKIIAWVQIDHFDSVIEFFKNNGNPLCFERISKDIENIYQNATSFFLYDLVKIAGIHRFEIPHFDEKQASETKELTDKAKILSEKLSAREAERKKEEEELLNLEMKQENLKKEMSDFGKKPKLPPSKY